MGLYIDKISGQPFIFNIRLTGVTTTATANNGIVLNGSAFQLGAELNMDTNIDGLDAYSFTLGDNSQIKNFDVNSNNTNIDSANIRLTTPTTGATHSSSLSILSGGTILISSTYTGFTGQQYQSNYSSKYTLRSIPDVNFVTGLTTTLSLRETNLENNYISGATNGLTKKGHKVILGGTLTGTTTIGINSHDLTFTGTTASLKYGSDLSGNYNLLLITTFNTYSGSTVRYITGTTYLTNIITDLKLTTVGKGIYIKEGTNATMGIRTLTGGTAVVSTNKVTAISRIFLTAQSLGTVAIPQALAITARSAGSSFTITSASLTDTSVIGWEIIEPA